MTTNQRYLAWSLGLVVLVLGGMLLLAPGDARIALDERRSALRPTPDGLAAFARTLDRWDRTVSYRFESYERVPPRHPVVALIEPIETLTRAEIGELLDWLDEGGVLLFSPVQGGPLSDTLDLGVVWFENPDSTTLEPDPWTEGVEPTPSYLFESETGAAGAPRFVGPGSSRFGHASVHPSRSPRAGWRPLVKHLTTRIPRDSTGTPIPDSAGVPVENVTVGWLEYGAGGVLVVADGLALTNAMLARSPEAIVAARAILALTESGDGVAFSEYHQGIRGEGTMLGQTLGGVLGSSVGRILAWLTLVALIVIWSRGRRFGSPIPRAPPPRRSPLEHVNALAGIYRSAGADRLVAERLIRGAARRGRVQTGASEDGVVEVLRRWGRLPAHQKAAARALEAWNATPPDLTRLARALDDIIPPRTTG